MIGHWSFREKNINCWIQILLFMIYDQIIDIIGKILILILILISKLSFSLVVHSLLLHFGPEILHASVVGLIWGLIRCVVWSLSTSSLGVSPQMMSTTGAGETSGSKRNLDHDSSDRKIILYSDPSHESQNQYIF